MAEQKFYDGISVDSLTSKFIDILEDEDDIELDEWLEAAENAFYLVNGE